MSFPKKTPTEIKLLTFDFSTEAAVGTTLSNAATTVTLATGTGAVVGDVTFTAISIVGQKVLVLAHGGLDACKYRVKAAADASNGEHHEIEKDLPIATAGDLVP